MLLMCSYSLIKERFCKAFPNKHRYQLALKSTTDYLAVLRHMWEQLGLLFFALFYKFGCFFCIMRYKQRQIAAVPTEFRCLGTSHISTIGRAIAVRGVRVPRLRICRPVRGILNSAMRPSVRHLQSNIFGRLLCWLACVLDACWYVL